MNAQAADPGGGTTDDRKALKKDTMLLLGDKTFRIGCLEGRGGSTLVYRAAYTDSLNQELEHYVIIKELFPWTPDGSIRRSADGSICCEPAGREILAQSGRRFREGNAANLRLLARRPAQISGNLDSFAAYGTYYSVLTVHGGMNLQKVLDAREADGRVLSLREILRIMFRLLDALECFHAEGLLHLGISPDNILLLPEQVLLIDYDSVCRQGNEADLRRYSSEKDGYTAPEVVLQETLNIGTASDLYAVSAVLFRMLTGRKYRMSDPGVRTVRDCFSQDPAVFRNEPKEACRRMVQIVCRGLHILARMRYQTTWEMRGDLKEVCRLLQTTAAGRDSP